jgi:dimethylargininase
VVALTREVSSRVGECELTHLSRVPIDVERARAQHSAYEQALTDLGCAVKRLAAGDEMADSVFIEDMAVVLDEVAVIMRPGAESRRGEIHAVLLALQPYRPLVRVEPPGTVDGGDVLVVGRSLFVGVTGRTNADGVAQMRVAAGRFGYDVRAVAVRGCLHLKSAVTAVNDETLLIQREWVPADAFRAFDLIDVHPLEPSAANILRIGRRLLYAAGFPRTRDILAERGFNATTVDVSELAKAEGAVTCCSLIFPVNRGGERRQAAIPESPVKPLSQADS